MVVFYAALGSYLTFRRTSSRLSMGKCHSLLVRSNTEPDTLCSGRGGGSGGAVAAAVAAFEDRLCCVDVKHGRVDRATCRRLVTYSVIPLRLGSAAWGACCEPRSVRRVGATASWRY